MRLADRPLFQVIEKQFGSIYYSKFQPGAELSGIVAYYWLIEQSENTPQVVSDIHIPDGLPEIIFIFDGAYYKQAVNREKEALKISASSIIGLQTRSHLINGAGRFRMLGIKLTPLGFFSLFRKFIAASTGEHIRLDELGIGWLLELQEKVEPIRSVQQIAALITNELLGQLNRNTIAHSVKLTSNCLSMIHQTQGRISVTELSKRHHLSIRQLQRYFKDHFDIAPKQFISIIRFKYFYKENFLLKTSLYDYHDFGYYDQAHFIKDFRRRTGVSPLEAMQHQFLMKNKIAEINLT